MVAYLIVLCQTSADWPVAAAQGSGQWLRTEALLRALVLKALQVSKASLGPHDLAPDADDAGSGHRGSGGADAGLEVELEAPVDERVGSRVGVLWPDDHKYYMARCVAVEGGGGPRALALIEYDDGGLREWLGPTEAVRWEAKPSAGWAAGAAALLDALRRHKSAGPFLGPVTEDQAPGYATVIATPMDLGTCHGKLHGGAYASLAAMANDVRLVFYNCRQYNAAGSPVYKMGVELGYRFEKSLEALNSSLNGSLNGSLHGSTGAPAKSALGKRSAPAPPSAAVAASAAAGGTGGAPAAEGEEGMEIEVPMTIGDVIALLPLKTDARRFDVPRGWFVRSKAHC
jgi:hypothetical protein